jgi:hypothetical protein
LSRRAIAALYLRMVGIFDDADETARRVRS